ncbi:glycosyltransferase family 39 protein [Candidatus Dojkabacteria bacterium]|nr:glycosyltransferase family 39 protein [Candidatus Dojkabacteria bacterium]
MKKVFNFWNVLVFTILLFALFVRVYRLPDILGFWYDQGRDALVIWDLIHNSKLFLIGPMMGNTGIFRGPWYYYLITPAYYFSNGNPIYANYFLILISVFGLFLLYKLGEKIGGKRLGLIALVIASFSSYVIGASRWLSNPTPTLLTGIGFIYFAIKLFERKWWALPSTALIIGMGLNFGAATEMFLIPALIFILYLKPKLIPNLKVIVLSILSFVFTFLPQIIFEIRHKGVMLKAFYNFVFNEKTFTINFVEILSGRIERYYDLFTSKFWNGNSVLFLPFFIIFIFFLVFKFKTYWKDDKFKVLFITFMSPFIGTLFFVSNLGGFYDYYFTAFYFVFILMFSYVFVDLLKTKLGKIALAGFLILFFIINYKSFDYYKTPLDNSEIIALKNQVDAISWIKSDARTDFNIDVYVPPVVPYAYDYLFKWQGLIQVEKQVELLYTLYEVDPPHPERLSAWLLRQEKIGKVVDEKVYGGITVQKRLRYEDF